MKFILRSIAAATGLFALGLQLWLMLLDPSRPGLVATVINFCSYFTILTNTLIAFAMLLPVVAPDSAVARFLSKPSVRIASAGYCIIVAVVYFLFLRNVGGDEDWELIADQLLHYVTPVLFTIDWLAFVPKGQVRWTIAGTSLVMPILYGIWTLVHGALTNWYPYSFFDVTRLGYLKTFVNFAGFMAMFVAAALCLVVIDRAIGLFRRQRIQSE